MFLETFFFNGTQLDLDKLPLPVWDGEGVVTFIFIFLMSSDSWRSSGQNHFLHRVVLVFEGGKARCFWGECRASDLLEDTHVFV